MKLTIKDNYSILQGLSPKDLMKFFQMVRNEKRFHRQAQEEIRILEHLRKQDKDNTFNIIHMYDT